MNPIHKAENPELEQNNPTQELFDMLTSIKDPDQLTPMFSQGIADIVGKSKRD